MDLRLFDYAIYLTAAAILTVWVSSTLHKNGRVFLVSVFPQEGLADSINHLLVVGFYLIRRPKRQRPTPVNPYYQQPATGA